MRKKEIQKIIDSQSREFWQNLFYQWVHDEFGRELLTRALLDNISLESIAQEKQLDYKTVYSKYDKGISQILKHINI